jgi:glycosyltransferase involved in cell wall biosynthesis
MVMQGLAATMDMPTPTRLPKLLYFGDVPVESSYHGSALLYRLLEDYPAERLMILECVHTASVPERRLRGIAYKHAHPARLVSRLRNSRLHRWAETLLVFTQKLLARRAEAHIGEFAPEGVLTVAHGHAWLAAALFAREHQIPLHLIIHDDWPTAMPVPSVLRRLLHRQFASVYRQAVSRLCVSPAMEAEYHHRYGVPGTVLYPSRASSLISFESPPVQPPSGARSFCIGFAGTLSTPSYVEVLKMMADELERLGGRLNIYGPISPDSASQMGLNRPNVSLRGLIPSNAIVHILREECDALLVPMSFSPEDREPMRLNFPSKLTDCTATALPLLIVGPPATSALQWADNHPGVALTVTRKDGGMFLHALKSLADDPELRMKLGRTAAEVGARQFSAAAAKRKFQDVLLSAATGMPL